MISIQTFLSRIPLLMSYPTIILSSNLIIPTYEDILEVLAKHMSEHMSEHHGAHDPQILPVAVHIVFVDVLIRLFLVPSFVATGFVLIGSRLKVLHGRTLSSLLPYFAFVFVTSQLNFILGPIQTTCLSILTVKHLTHFGDTLNKKNLLLFLKSYVPLLILCVIINHNNSNPFTSAKENYNGWLFSLAIYSLWVILLRVFYPLASRLTGTDKRTRDYSTDLHTDNTDTPLTALLTFFLIVSLALVFLLAGRFLHYNIQILMVFVYFGSLTIFFFTIRDSAADLYEEELKEHGVANTHTGYMYKNLLPNYTILVIGFMSMALQDLSFNKIASSFFNDVLTVIFIVLTEVFARLVDIEDSEHLHTHSHSHTHEHGHEDESDHVSELSTVGEGNIFRQMFVDENTRSIFSFLLLNTTFMFVQLLYSFRSKSLGLLSDSLHMALDCTSLFLGLLASILSKRKPSSKFPFGLEYLETLAGFTNGILLIGIVSGILVESVGRLFYPVHICETNELLIISILGLLVNLVGLLAFDHGDSHGSGEQREGSSIDDENMRGIFLHVLADTLGSVGVIASTVAIKLTGWQIFDPLASIMIAVLILLSAIPLLRSTSSNILLKLDDKKHNIVKNALNQISLTPGITGYTTPRFWPYKPRNSGGRSHSHTHGHSHSHIHDHSHDHEEKLEGARLRNKKNNSLLVGYIHIQYNEGENSAIIKKRVEKILTDFGIRAWIQVEPQNSQCWCRSTSMSSIAIASIPNKRASVVGTGNMGPIMIANGRGQELAPSDTSAEYSFNS